MPRTTATAVREIISTSLLDTQINAFIADANVWVTEEISTFSPTPSVARLEIIERYLACALIRLRDLGLKSVTLADVSENYQADDTTTEYLTRAAAFDPTGKITQNFLGAAGDTGTTAPTPVQFKVATSFTDDTSTEE